MFTCVLINGNRIRLHITLKFPNKDKVNLLPLNNNHPYPVCTVGKILIPGLNNNHNKKQTKQMKETIAKYIESQCQWVGQITDSKI